MKSFITTPLTIFRPVSAASFYEFYTRHFLFIAQLVFLGSLTIIFSSLIGDFPLVLFFVLQASGGGGPSGGPQGGGPGENSYSPSCNSSSDHSSTNGGGGGPSCECACACGDCAGCASSGACASASCSTPFLYVQNENNFLMDNDVMFGKPSSLFTDIDSGVRSFKRGEITPDLYLVQKPIQADANGDVKLQIREIEPEVSAIFYTSLKRLAVKRSEEVFVTSNFGGCIRATTDNKIQWGSLKCTDKDSNDVTKILIHNPTKQSDTKEYVSLETEDFIDVTFNTNDVRNHYLILESWYRDWTLGNVYSKENSQNFIVSPYQAVVKKAKKGLLAGTFALCLGYFGFNLNSGNGADADLLANSFGLSAPKALADAPSCSSCSNCGSRSLEITYRDTVTNQKVDIIEPRYARPYAVAVKIPEDSLQNGICSFRVTATKRHRVTGIAVVEGSQVDDSEYEEMSLTKAYHHREKIDYVNILSVKDNNFVKTLPSDVITLQFAPVGKDKNQNTEYKYLFEIGGVYAPATEVEQAVVGDWVPRLDEEAKNFIADVYKESFDGELQFKS